MAKKYRKYTRRGRGRAWGNALGGYRSQSRVDGQFASGKGGNRKSAKARRAEGYRKKKAKDRKRRNRNVAIGAAVGATLIVGAGAYAHSRQKSSPTNGVQMKTMRPVKRRPKSVIPSSPKVVTGVTRQAVKKVERPAKPINPKSVVQQAREIQGQRANARERMSTYRYSGDKGVWRDEHNRSTKFGTLKPGAKTNGSQDIFTGAMPRATGRLKITDTNALNAAMEDYAASQGIQLGTTTSKSVRRTPRMTKGQLAGALRKDRARHSQRALNNGRALWHGVQTGQIKTVPGAGSLAVLNGQKLWDSQYTKKGTKRVRPKKFS
ncbi:hypothetical protein SEA_DUMPTRUCK_7 [Gordonia phage DumpTruck]|nr:hypothetical protein SEA_DUMPTRUCK_7 [Gordonia phage DumpTruck]